MRSEKEKEENVWRRKISVLWRRRKTEKEKKENIWRRKICGGEGKIAAGGRDGTQRLLKKSLK